MMRWIYRLAYWEDRVIEWFGYIFMFGVSCLVALFSRARAQTMRERLKRERDRLPWFVFSYWYSVLIDNLFLLLPVKMYFEGVLFFILSLIVDMVYVLLLIYVWRNKDQAEFRACCKEFRAEPVAVKWRNHALCTLVGAGIPCLLIYLVLR